MKNLVPRLISESEAKMLGVQHGWYGTKVSGTFVTGPFSELSACVEEMDRLPEPVEPITEHLPAKAGPKPRSDNVDSTDYNLLSRAAYQMERKRH